MLQDSGFLLIDDICWWKRNASAIQDDETMVDISSPEDYRKRNEAEVSSHPQ